MVEPTIFVLTPKADSSCFRDRVLRDVIPRHRKKIVILEDEAFGIDNVTNAAQAISDLIDDSNCDPKESHLLVVKTARSHHAKLEHRWEDAGREAGHVYVQDRRRVLAKLDRLLMKCGYHWRSYACGQLTNFQGQYTPLDKWCGQFFDLGVGYLGRRIAMQIEVIGFDQGRGAFRPNLQDTIGMKSLHCFVNDGDHGGSWIGVQDQLSHDLPEEAVHGVKFADGRIILPDVEFDELILYEDGLWSGSETVKRLRAIKTSGLDKPIRLRFLVTTDFGLLVVRQAIREYGLQGLVSVDAAGARLERFLSKSIPETEQFGRGVLPEEFFGKLHKYVEQGAFRDPKEWTEDIADARGVASEIGGQLVSRWYKDARPGEDYQDGIEKFSLGGGGFASTLAFQRSVPKVCLPLLWLAGPVELNGKKVDWRPLFLDARRVDPSLLLGGD